MLTKHSFLMKLFADLLHFQGFGLIKSLYSEISIVYRILAKTYQNLISEVSGKKYWVAMIHIHVTHTKMSLESSTGGPHFHEYFKFREKLSKWLCYVE